MLARGNAFTCRLVLLTSFITAPFWVMLYYKWPRTVDVLFYSTMIRDFSAQLWQGDLYPRWLMDINSGYGSPVFLFYGPACFYLLSLLQFLSSIDPHGFGRLVIGMHLALLVSGFTCYRWLRGHMPDAQAQKGALLYAAFPYMPVLIYYNYGLASLWAIALLPLILHAIDSLRLRAWRGIPVLSLFYALLFLTHLPTALCSFIIPPTYAAYVAGKGRRLLHVALVGASGCLAICLSAVYLVPMQFNRPFIRADLFTSGDFDYARHFWMIHTLFGFLCFIPPLIGLFIEQPRPRRLALAGQAGYWCAVLAFLFFMILPVSKFLWDALPPLQHLQFPMRFYTAMFPGAAFLAACWLQRARTRHIYGGLLAIMLATTIVQSWDSWFSYDEKEIHDKPFVGIGTSHEYRTQWMTISNVFIRDMPSGPGLVAVKEGEGHASITAWEPRKIAFHADIAAGGARLVFHRFYYPGWQGAPTEPSESLLSLQLPQGVHDIILSQPEFAGEKLGQGISVAAAFVLFLWYGVTRRKITA